MIPEMKATTKPRTAMISVYANMTQDGKPPIRSVINGETDHSVWAETGTDAAVFVVNDEDGHYSLKLRNLAEVEAFIAQLRVAASEAWPG